MYQLHKQLRAGSEMAKDIDSVFQIIEIPLDGAQCLSQLGGGPIELVARDRRGGGDPAAHRCARRRNRQVLQLTPAAVQTAVLVQRFADFAESPKSFVIDHYIFYARRARKSHKRISVRIKHECTIEREMTEFKCKI